MSRGEATARRPGDRWFTARTEAERQATLEALVEEATSDDPAIAGPACTALIELVHFAVHPRARLPVLRALGRCRGRARVLPALHAELDSPDPAVLVAALEAIGRVGLPYGGVLVRRWLEARRAEDLPPEVLGAALVALGRTHPALAEEAAGRWSHLVDPEDLHVALAEACSPALLEPVDDDPEDPRDAAALLLHLAAIRPDDLATRLAPAHGAADPLLRLLADLALQRRPDDPADEVVALLTDPAPPEVRDRRARALRRHDPRAVVEAFQALWSGEPEASPDRWRLLALALSSGLPALQDAVLETVAAQPALLARALARVHTATPALARRLPEWVEHPDDAVAAAAIRAWTNTRPDEALEQLDRLHRSRRPVHRREWARMVQQAWRDHEDEAGRSTLPHRQRAELARRLRVLIRRDPDPATREIALFTAGNLGLTDLVDDLARVACDLAAPWRLRRAAATALGEFPVPEGVIDRLAAALEAEPHPDVLFRLALALHQAALRSPASRPGLARAALRRLEDAPPRERCVLLGLLGAARVRAHGALLAATAQAGQPVTAADVALTALGHLGDPAHLDVLASALRAPSRLRRLRAAEALGRLGDPRAVPLLLDVAASGEEAPEVRRAAIDALSRLRPGPELLEALAPAGPDDPLAWPILALRQELLEGGGEPADVDARLREAAPGFDPVRTARRHPDAVTALRTAEYLSAPAGRLPPGLDASPAALLWVKGLELWTHGLLRGALPALGRSAARRALRGLADRWHEAREDLAPGWPAAEGPPFHDLADTVDDMASRPPSRHRVGSLRQAAALLLILGRETPAPEPALPRLSLGLSSLERSLLAHGLFRLGRLRNPLAHARTARPEDARSIRERALEAVALLARVQRALARQGHPGRRPGDPG